jgi:potassium efflux system protein
MFAGLRWLTARENWSAVGRTASETAREFPFAFAFSLFVLGLLVGIRRSLRQRMASIAEPPDGAATVPFKATLECLVYTILLAAPIPLFLYLASSILSQSDVPSFVFAMAGTLGYLTSIALLFELLRQLLAPHGLAEAHFGLPRHVTRLAYRGLLWPVVLFLPAIFVAVQLGSSGMRLDSPDSLQVYNNSLGRVVFFMAMMGFGAALIGLFRPRKRTDEASDGHPLSWAERLYLFIYPFVVLGTIVPAILAIFGFYITGYLLAYQILRTAWLVVVLALVNELLIRWRTTSRLRAEGSVKEGAEADVEVAALKEADAQVRQLSRVVLVLIAIVGFYGIWSGAVPALQIMKRVQVLPRLAIIEASRDDRLVPSDPSALVEATEPAEPAAKAESDAPPTIPGLPKPSSSAPAATGGEPEAASALTLWDIFRFVVAFAVTLLLVKNVPGVLELTLRRRTRVDPGARIAVITLVRYMIMIVGFTSAFSHLGISWSKIQWLAAALTFGLGFGLQEIVANFVSGLILLLERPVRVGDAVTIGNLQGRVSRIHIRATTITLWDRSEMIVPNKEFITTKLVNWTLSDSKRRVDIPVRVSYGADLATVRQTLLEVAGQNPDVLHDPPPVVLLLNFGDDALKFELRYYVDFGQGLKTRDALHLAVERAFREKGIEFALPQIKIQAPPATS